MFKKQKKIKKIKKNIITSERSVFERVCACVIQLQTTKKYNKMIKKHKKYLKNQKTQKNQKNIKIKAARDKYKNK